MINDASTGIYLDWKYPFLPTYSHTFIRMLPRGDIVQAQEAIQHVPFAAPPHLVAIPCKGFLPPQTTCLRSQVPFHSSANPLSCLKVPTPTLAMLLRKDSSTRTLTLVHMSLAALQPRCQPKSPLVGIVERVQRTRNQGLRPKFGMNGWCTRMVAHARCGVSCASRLDVHEERLSSTCHGSFWANGIR